MYADHLKNVTLIFKTIEKWQNTGNEFNKITGGGIVYMSSQEQNFVVSQED